MRLRGNKIWLRALEPEDLEFVLRVENDEQMWAYGNTRTPFSRFVIRQYLENSHQDIFTAKQLRLAICLPNTFDAIGLIDLYDYDPVHNRAGVGIIVDYFAREKGFAGEALSMLANYAFGTLNIHQLFAHIDCENQPSLRLFATFGFRECGIRKEWNLVDGRYRDESIYQLINH